MADIEIYRSVGDCLGPAHPSGRNIAVQPGGVVNPGMLAAFESMAAEPSEEFPNCTKAVKVYLGIANSGCMYERLDIDLTAGPVAIFWMANPETIIGVPLKEMSYLAPVVGSLGRERSYSRAAAWISDEQHREFVDSVKPHLLPLSLVLRPRGSFDHLVAQPMVLPSLEAA